MTHSVLKRYIKVSFLVFLVVLLPVLITTPSFAASTHRSPEFAPNFTPLTITQTLHFPIVFAANNNPPFGYGVQPNPAGNTNANVSHIQTLGLSWVKFYMAWRDVEFSSGDYSWSFWDEAIGAYSANGIKVMLTIAKAPDWARPSNDEKSVDGLPADPATYAAFVSQVAQRYQGKVQAIEIWYDQNLWYAVGGRGRINAAVYVQLLQAAYQAIKAVDSNITVISGAMAPAGNVGDLAVDDIDYLNQMYGYSAKAYFDAVGAHPAGYLCPALADWRTVTPQEATADPDHGTFTNRHHSWCFLGTMEGYRNVMVAQGDSFKMIVPTAFGWAVHNNPNSGYEYARSNTYEEQAQWIVQAFQWGKSQGWVGPMLLWNLDYSVTAPGTELSYFSLLTSNGVVPAYTAIANMPK